MASINKVILISNLGADPEMRYTPGGDAVCTLRLATTDKWKDKVSGDMHEPTEWHRVVLFRRLAEVAKEYLKKGSPVYVEGRLRTRKWEDKDGLRCCGDRKHGHWNKRPLASQALRRPAMSGTRISVAWNGACTDSRR